MTGPSHVVVGIASSVTVSLATNLVPTAPYFLLLLLGSLAPDIDGGGAITRPGTILRRFFPWRIVKIFDSFGLAAGAVAQSISSHRGLFHWPLWGILMIVFGLFIPNPISFWFGVGYLSHSLADSLTKGGIPVFAPFSFERRSLIGFKSGSFIEAVLSFTLFLYSIYFGWQFLPLGVIETFERVGAMLHGE